MNERVAQQLLAIGEIRYQHQRQIVSAVNQAFFQSESFLFYDPNLNIRKGSLKAR